MKLNDKRLDEWLRWAPANQRGARQKNALSRRYDAISERLSDAHRNAVALATAAEARRQANAGEEINPGLLTDHGEAHIAKVIERASALVSGDKFLGLSPLEVFILLVAIQLHDVGNALGRERHEERVYETLHQVRGDDVDAFGARMICLIAEAHGGQVAGSKDRIGQITAAEEKLDDERVRLHLLAALLRFADELAEDHTRAARFALGAGALPEKSKAYHHYADSLKSVTIDPDNHEVSLRYVLTRELATEMVGKDDGRVFLLDYILERTHKMHYERIYCSRYMAPWGIRIDKLKVEILFLDHIAREFHPRISYRLEDRGYPTQDLLEALRPEGLVVPGRDMLWCGDLLKRTLEGDANA